MKRLCRFLACLALLTPLQSSGQYLYLTSPECQCTSSGGSGDITAVGDVASGAAFDGTDGTTLTFNDSDGDQTISYDTTNDRFVLSDDLRLPASAGSSVSLRIGTTDTGFKDASGSGQFTVRVAGTDRADFIAGLGWRLLDTTNIYWTVVGDVGFQIGNRINFGGGNGLRIYGQGASGTEQYVGVGAGDFSTVSRGLATYRRLEVTTAVSGSPRVLDAAADVGRTLANTGATARTYATLPSAAAGMNYGFIATDSDGWRVTAASGDTIHVGATASTAGGYCESSALGDSLVLLATGTDDWFAIPAAGGTWLCF